MKTELRVAGMTCEGCAAKVAHLLRQLPGVEEVRVDHAQGLAVIKSRRVVSEADASGALHGTKYQVVLEAGEKEANDMEPFALRTYYPLALVISFITLVSAITSWSHGTIDPMRFMAHFMAGFFIAFSFFKLLDVRGFADSYAGYDLLAMKWKGYGLVYPFIESALGAGYLLVAHAWWLNVATIGVMGFSLLGVLRAVLNKQRIRCACLGTVFNLPMSTVTIAEDALMIAMAALMLVLGA
ncbi:MAG: cation transporter [Flavobacteriales bacterium]|nr:cation transporter [Flavobacteriales bacterium]